MEDACNPSSPPSFRNKIKDSLCFSCCFRRRDGGGHFSIHHCPPSPSDDSPAVVWVKPHDHSLLEIKDKCRAMLGLAGAKHRRHSSVEFRYDPLSYAMNFEDGFDCDDEAPLRNFAARLPPPPVPSAVSWKRSPLLLRKTESARGCCFALNGFWFVNIISLFCYRNLLRLTLMLINFGEFIAFCLWMLLSNSGSEGYTKLLQ